jgi:hypothetical protein
MFEYYGKFKNIYLSKDLTFQDGIDILIWQRFLPNKAHDFILWNMSYVLNFESLRHKRIKELSKECNGNIKVHLETKGGGDNKDDLFSDNARYEFKTVTDQICNKLERKIKDLTPTEGMENQKMQLGKFQFGQLCHRNLYGIKKYQEDINDPSVEKCPDLFYFLIDLDTLAIIIIRVENKMETKEKTNFGCLEIDMGNN